MYIISGREGGGGGGREGGRAGEVRGVDSAEDQIFRDPVFFSPERFLDDATCMDID